MSFHSDLIADAVLPSDVRTALGFLEPESVYAGRTPRRLRQDPEVWIERLEAAQVGEGGGSQSVDHTYALHVRSGIKNRGPDGSDKAKQDVVEAHMRTLVDRYDRARPFAAVSSMADLVVAMAEEGSVDVDPADDLILDGSVFITFHVRV